MVLLSAYNGEKYLDTQLQSLREQIYEHVRVIVRDDGSTDNTIKILEKWHNKYPEWLTWYSGTNIGYKKSFITFNALQQHFIIITHHSSNDLSNILLLLKK